jgi:hypothetical protein
LNLSNNFLDGLILGNSLEGKIPSQLGGYVNALTIDNSEGQWLSNLTSLTHLLHMLSISDLDKFHSLFQMID